MPRNLPGLYWDEAKKRYFPLASRPPPGDQSGQSSTNVPWESTEFSPHIDAKTRKPLGEARLPDSNTRGTAFMSSRLTVNILRLPRNRPYNDHSSSKILSRNIATSEGRPFWDGDLSFSSLDVTVHPNGGFAALTGDTGGWLHTYRTDKHGYPYGGQKELSLGSEVTSICQSGSSRLAVSFGPSSKIAVETITEDAEMWNVISMGKNHCYDVRTAHSFGRSLVLGAARKAILLPDIHVGPNFETLSTSSDVFSVHQIENIVYTGSRNGSIQRFDRRLKPRQRGETLFDGRFNNDNRSITHISIYNESQMLVSTIKGDIELLDLRYARKSEPLVAFRGHVNTYTPNLGITTTPCSSHIFASGQDRRIRAWSMHTGELISYKHPPQSDPRAPSSLFNHTFDQPILAMQVTEGGGGGGASANGMTLWAVSGREVHRFWLGQRINEEAMAY